MTWDLGSITQERIKTIHRVITKTNSRLVDSMSREQPIQTGAEVGLQEGWCQEKKKNEWGHCKFDHVENYWEVFYSAVEGYRKTKRSKMLSRIDDNGQSCVVFHLAAKAPGENCLYICMLFTISFS